MSGHRKPRPLEGSPSSLYAIPLKKKEAKRFHLILQIYPHGPICGAWCVLIPVETVSLPAFCALIIGTEGFMQHYHLERLRTAFSFHAESDTERGAKKTARSPQGSLQSAWQGLKGGDNQDENRLFVVPLEKLTTVILDQYHIPYPKIKGGCWGGVGGGGKKHFTCTIKYLHPAQRLAVTFLMAQIALKIRSLFIVAGCKVGLNLHFKSPGAVQMGYLMQIMKSTSNK